MAPDPTETVLLSKTEDILVARHTVRDWAERLGFGLVDQTRLVTAASELARNALIHGGGGLLHLRALDRSGRVGLELIVEDQGPGIPDKDLAMQDHYSTSGGLGLGLGGTRRLVDEFQLESVPGKGTRVRVARWT